MRRVSSIKLLAGVNVETSHQATAPLASLLELKSFHDLKSVYLCVCMWVCVNDRVYPRGPGKHT